MNKMYAPKKENILKLKKAKELLKLKNIHNGR
jgi:hypothetical protein